MSERHPGLADDDVRSAWEDQYRATIHETGSGLHHVAVSHAVALNPGADALHPAVTHAGERLGVPTLDDVVPLI